MGERSRVGLAVPETLSRGEMEGSRLTAATCRFGLARPNAIGHVCVGDVRYSGFAGVSNILLKPPDLFVASWQVERYLFNIAVLIVRDIPELQAGRFDAFSNGEEVLQSRTPVSGLDVQILYAHLFDPGQILSGNLLVNLHRYLNAGRQWFERLGLSNWAEGRGCSRTRENPACHFHNESTPGERSYPH